jgi:hypothetical protein
VRLARHGVATMLLLVGASTARALCPADPNDPADILAARTALYPTCGGVCPDGPERCQAFYVDTLTICSCIDSTLTCGCNAPGACLAGEVCNFDPPCGCGPPP